MTTQTCPHFHICNPSTHCQFTFRCSLQHLQRTSCPSVLNRERFPIWLDTLSETSTRASRATCKMPSTAESVQTLHCDALLLDSQCIYIFDIGWLDLKMSGEEAGAGSLLDRGQSVSSAGSQSESSFKPFSAQKIPVRYLKFC